MPKLQDRVEVAYPQQTHLAVALLLDVSGSMNEGGKIAQLNEALVMFKQALSDPSEVTSRAVELAVVTFGLGVNTIQAFAPLEQWEVRPLSADGYTPMGEAILRGIELVRQRRLDYEKSGVDKYRPWIYLITDGQATDMEPGTERWTSVTKAIQAGLANRDFVFYAVGVAPCEMQVLKDLVGTPPAILKPPFDFKAMFQWIVASARATSASSPGDVVKTEPIDAWGQIYTD